MASHSPALRFRVSGTAPAIRLRAVESQAPEPIEFRERPAVPWLIALADVVAAQLALALGVLARHVTASWLGRDVGQASYQGIILGLLALPLANWLMGLYPGYGLGSVERLRRRVVAAAITFTALVVWDNLILMGMWSRGVEVLSFGCALFISPLMDVTVVTVLMRCDWWGTPVIVLASEDTGPRLITSLQRRRELGLVPIGLLRDSPESWGATVGGVPVLGPVSLAGSLSARASTALVAMPGFQRNVLPSLLSDLPFPKVVFVPDLPGLQSLWTTARDLGGTLGIEFRRNLLIKRNYYLKRALDYAISVPLFLVSVPVIALCALCIKRISPGPAFYRQEREGFRGEKILVWKLRTMYPNAEQLLVRYLDGHPKEAAHWRKYFKLEHDPRILPGIGHLLRRTSLDELPQLWNILKGDMSLVGPRPFPGYHLAAFGADFRELRQSVPPGLTGFWQVSERSDADLQLQQHLDTYYIRNWSPWLDAYILARTIKTVLMPRGAY